MKNEDWNRLCKTIYQNKCILFIGQEFPVYFNKTGKKSLTSFNQILSLFLCEEILKLESVPKTIKDTLEKREFSQIAREYIKYKHLGNKELARDDLGGLISDFFIKQENNFSSPHFDSLIEKLPITFIVDTNFSNFFYKKIESHTNRKIAHSFTHSYYDFKGDKVDMVGLGRNKDLGVLDSPFFYNLFGYANKPDSMVLSEYEWIEFVISLISKNPGLPKDVKSQLVDNDDRYFLFIGFGILSRNWYFRILMQALASFNGKKSISYALDYIGNVEETDPSVMFFKDDLKVGIYKFEPKTFVDELIQKYLERYPETKDETKEGKGSVDIPVDAPKVFISYKRENYDKAKDIYDALRKVEIDAFLDTEKIEGAWKETILDQIKNEVQTFVLLQSKELKEAGESEVYREIDEAFERAKRFPTKDRFVQLGYLDNEDSILKSPQWLKEIHSHDLSNPEIWTRFIKLVKRACERNMKRYGTTQSNQF